MILLNCRSADMKKLSKLFIWRLKINESWRKDWQPSEKKKKAQYTRIFYQPRELILAINILVYKIHVYKRNERN